MKRARVVWMLLGFLFVIGSVSAQVKNNVVKFHAFIKATGNDHLHYLYAETTGKFLPQWNMVYTRSGVFAIQAEEVDSTRITIGKIKNSAKHSIITHRRGNRLWKLNLVPVKAKTPAHIAALLKTVEAVVMTELGGKPFTHTIAKETQLETFISQ